MHRKYLVRLSDEERGVCQDVVKRLKGTSEKVKGDAHPTECPPR